MGWLKKAVKSVTKVASTAVNIGSLGIVGKEKSKALVSKGLSLGLVGVDKEGNIGSGDMTKNIVKGIATITGARAMEKSMNAQLEQQKAEQARASLISDALANAESNTETGKVNFRKKRSTNKISNSAGLGGVTQSDSTGVQS